MKMNSSKMFFLGFMITGVMLCLCSNNWLFIWCGLELSLISFLPLIHSTQIISSESSMKYFLVQSVSSGMLILGLMMMLTLKLNYNLIIASSILIKMGVAPFHSWLLGVVEGLSMIPMMLMFTVSKIAPLMMLTFITLSLALIICLTMVTGAMLGLNQSSTRKIITYSSIFNMGLILMSIKNNFIWFYYLVIYSILVSMLVFLIFKMNMFYVNQMITMENLMSYKMGLWFILLSMGGMPPFVGFSIKLIVIEFSVIHQMTINLIIMILFSLLVMFFYLRLSYLSIMFFSMSNKWMTLNLSKMPMMFMMFNTLTLPIYLTTKIFY
uniref:NADH-ubiquinone oxidoreductase chain 2 n=1 Tax=Empoascanara angkhangica TaxID=3057149 RepID=A0AA51REZ2_9HEMI|nr:NADH dehydrogenase subunit 2 [Empoascanara angkhangica]WMQ52400.1 NADH dehydrogenase subunit 2 [Empoascanara angkhangica]